MSKFIFMLTYDDETVANALEVYSSVRHLAVEHVGFKDVGLPEADLRTLTSAIKGDGRAAFLEVVSLTDDGELRAADLAVRLGIDYLIGGMRMNMVARAIRGTGIRYFPYVGEVIGHPARLVGSEAAILDDAREAEAFGADGINLLAYRYAGDGAALARAVVATVNVPVICAGSIDSLERVKQVIGAGVWGFTIGGAVFARAIVPSGSLEDQVNSVLKAALVI